MEPATWKLSQLCDEVQAVLGECLQPTYWVEAEISSLSDRGHCCLELVEKSENGLFAAKVRATCWQSTWRMLRAYFLEETGQQPAVGMQVLLEVSGLGKGVKSFKEGMNDVRKELDDISTDIETDSKEEKK